MSSAYLSPAFGARTPDEIEFLRTADERTDFTLFWHDIVRPTLEHAAARCCLEIGADRGEHTRKLQAYCEETGAHLIVVDPVISPELRDVTNSHPRTRLLAERSHPVLETLDERIDVVFLQGDRNYYAVLNDLRGIAALARRTGSAFPMVFLRGLAWPYARRDMYYDPQAIPPQDRHEFVRAGMHPFDPALRAGRVNWPYANAVHEGGPRNGIATAVEDFIAASDVPFSFRRLPIQHGFGALFAADSPGAEFVAEALRVSPQLERLLEAYEIARLNVHLKSLERSRLRAAAGTVTGRRIRAAGRRVLTWIGI